MSKMFVENLVYKPFAYPWAVDIDKRHETLHWTEDEIPLGDDVFAWKNGKLSEDEKDFVTNILKMFTTQDVMVGGFYYNKLIPVFKNNEIRNMLGGFAVREKTHQRAYALLNDTLGLPESEYASFMDFSILKEKAEFALEADSNTKEGMALSLAKGVFNEGVSLFASFVMLLNFQRFGKMLGMCKVVEWSIRDETVHVEGVSQLFRTFCIENPRVVTNKFKTKIYDMAREIVRLEDAFVDMVYGQHKNEGLGAEEVKKYIRFIADRRLNQLGLKENFIVDKNPLPWLDWVVSAATHTNFFEGKVAEYEVAGLQGDIIYSEIKKRKFLIYYRDGCPYCDKAKELVISKGFEYTGVNLNDYTQRQEFYQANGFTEKTVPKIYEILDDTQIYIGGYTQLLSYFN